MTTPTPRTQADDTAEKLHARITNYLGNGGLFNPEMMEHEKVRDLLLDCRIMANCYMHYQRELSEARTERDAYRNGGVTEEILRRNDGHIKVGNGCEIAIRETTADLTRLRAVADELAGALENAALALEAIPVDTESVYWQYRQMQVNIAREHGARYHAATNPASVAANTGVNHRTE